MAGLTTPRNCQHSAVTAMESFSVSNFESDVALLSIQVYSFCCLLLYEVCLFDQQCSVVLLADPIRPGVECKVCRMTVHTKCQMYVPFCSGVSMNTHTPIYYLFILLSVTMSFIPLPLSGSSCSKVSNTKETKAQGSDAETQEPEQSTRITK